MPERRPPAADAVPPPVGLHLSRALLYITLALIGVAAFWAGATEVDVVVRAEGRLAPRGQPLRLSVPRGGIVSEVYVAVGDAVKQDDPLLRIDAYREDADAERLRHELEAAQAETGRLQESARKLRDVLGGGREERSKQQEVCDSLSAELAKYRDLESRGTVSAMEVNKKERAVSEAYARLARLQTDLLRAEEEIESTERLATEAASRAGALEADLARAAEAQRRTLLKAPHAGTVTYLVSARPGRHLSPGEDAVSIVPADEPLFAEIRIPNESMRRVQESLPARLKFKAFPYQDYGVVTGRLVQVEPDADAEGVYRAWVSLDRFTLNGPRGVEELRTGLQLTTEIVVDRRSLFAVVLDPFRKLKGGLTVSE